MDDSKIDLHVRIYESMEVNQKLKGTHGDTLFPP